MKLLDVAEVHRGDGRWTSGLTVEGLQCSLTSSVGAVCLPSPIGLIGGVGGEGQPTGYPISVFGIIAQLARPTMCQTTDPEGAVRKAVEDEADKAIGRALWYGTGEASMWLGADGATSVAADAGIGVMLKTFYDKTVGVDPVIHLGYGVADDLSPKLNPDGRFSAFPEVPVVINAGYPVDGVAITGPIEAWVGSIEQTQVHNTRINREYTEATALGAVAFDPCAVVIRGALPDQVYVGSTGTDSVVVYVSGSETASTVDWGDSTANGSVAPDGSDSHTYAAPGTYTITVTSESGPTTYTVTTT